MHTTFFWLLFSKIVIYYVFGNFASEEHHSTQHWSQSELTCGAEILFNLGSLLQLCKLQSIQCFFSLSHFLGLDCSQEPFFKKSISIFLYVYSPILLGWVFINGHRYILSFLTCTTLTYFSASPNLLFLPFHLFTYAVVYLFYLTWQEAKVRSNLENIFSLDSLTPSHVFDWSTFCPNSFTSYLCFLNRHSFLPYFSTPQPSVPSPYHHRYVICLSFSTFHFSAAALTSSSLIPWTL